MDLRLLEYFHQAALLSSFTRAAERLHVTQSALSQGIKLLETRLGRPLFVRGRKLELTDFGQQFLERARRVLEAVEQLRTELEPGQQELAGTVRAAVLVSVLSHVLPPTIARFTRNHPRVGFDFVKTDPAAIEALVTSGDCQFGISPIRPGPGPIDSRLLISSPFVLAVPRTWQGRPLDEMLQDAPLVVLAPWHVEELGRHTDLFRRFPGARLQEGTNCVVITRQLISLGVGPGVIPGYALGTDLAVVETFEGLSLPLYLLRRREGVRLPASEAFLEALIEDLAGVQSSPPGTRHAECVVEPRAAPAPAPRPRTTTGTRASRRPARTRVGARRTTH